MDLHIIYLVHEDQTSKVAEFEMQLASDVAALKLDPAQFYRVIRVRSGADLVHTADEGASLAVALYFGSEVGCSSLGCHDAIEALLAAKVPVVPVLREDQGFSTTVPSSLTPINALFHALDELITVSNFVLRSIGLTESQRRVFVSYRRSDALHMGEELWETLGKAGFDVFLDRFSIEPGADFQRRLEQRLREKAFVLLIESPDLQSSQWVLHEVSFAQKNRLGLLALTWNETIAAKKTLENLRPESRHLLDAAEYTVQSDRQGNFTTAFLHALPRKVEQVHGKAMRERRRQLLGSVLVELDRRKLAWKPLSAWTVLVELPENGLDAKRRVAMSVTPRPPEIPDLFVLDNLFARSGQPYDAAWLVHAATEDEETMEQLRWAVGARRIGLVNEDSIVALVNAF